jgi:sugar (pentulose or hexulose) kinase
LVIQPLLTGNVTWDWALKCWIDPTPERAMQEQQRVFTDSLLPPFGLTAIPWLNRPHPFRPDCIGGASLVGIGPSTTREDLLRAIASAMVFEFDRVFEEVMGRGVVDSVVLSGGASRGNHFVHLIAALFDPLPVVRIEEEDWTGARGSLYAFSPHVAQASAVPVDLPQSIDREAVAAGRALYRDVFQALGSNVPAAERYRAD